ncbi:hypothetical protein KEM56_007438 [Ascosphaera pollenicola]|nr:hypothetical protein KEM56_007438 [Ascosphaera pollenicola]
MAARSIISLLLAIGHASGAPTDLSKDGITVPLTVPKNAAAPIFQPFLCYSIEFFFWPDFAGNFTHPNTFSNNLLDNLGQLQGQKPYIRVGGNSQDLSIFDASLPTATAGTIDEHAKLTDYPMKSKIGPSFFESYHTFPNTKFTYGFNLAANGTLGEKITNETVPLVCKALANGRLAYLKVGNEPDHFGTVNQTTDVYLRPKNWTEKGYVSDWLARTRLIRERMRLYCPEFKEDEIKFLAPSFAEKDNFVLDPVKVWGKEKLGRDHDIVLNSMHNYIDGAHEPGVNLANTLLNHTKLKSSISHHLEIRKKIQANTSGKDIPYILGETNSLFQGGAPALSNSFGAALWNVDFSLYVASKGMGRVHMHHGTDYRYNSWQPVQTEKTTIGTKGPYYGNIMTAAMMGGDGLGETRITELSLGKKKDEVKEVAYAAYVGDQLKRVAVINMMTYNYTDTPTGEKKVPTGNETRPSETYSFRLSEGGRPALVQRLMANGSDAITGITFDGWSYNYELAQGRPVRMANVTVGEVVWPDRNGFVEVTLPHSSAAILTRYL